MKAGRVNPKKEAEEERAEDHLAFGGR
jgi:hypothetical protein